MNPLKRALAGAAVLALTAIAPSAHAATADDLMKSRLGTTEASP